MNNREELFLGDNINNIDNYENSLLNIFSIFKQKNELSTEEIEKIFGKLPEGATIEEANLDYCVFVTNENRKENFGFKTIRFNVDKSYIITPCDVEDRIPSEWTMALRYNNQIIVAEGTHRVIHAFQGGDILPADLGGVLERPKILEYTFDPEPDEDKNYDFFKIAMPVTQYINYINPNKYL